MNGFLAPLFQTGFFESSTVGTGVLVSGIAAVVSGALGVFMVMRGQSFAGHALGDTGATGGSAAYLAGLANPLWGFLAFNVVAAAAMELAGIQWARGRDLATGIVLGCGLGLAALFLYLDTTERPTTGATVTVLFGSLFATSASTIPLVAALAGVVVAILVVIHRPLLLATVSRDLAAARGIPVRTIGAAYLLALAVCVALAALTIGSIMSTALLVGPAAAALRITRRPGLAVLTAVLLGVAASWVGIVLAYDSYYWPPQQHGWPVSFFIVALLFVIYLLSGIPATRQRLRRQRDAAPEPASA